MENKTLLLIEDDRPIRDTFALALEMEGYRVLTAANGLEGLEQLRKNSDVKLILLDLMMPVMNGWQFVEALRGDPRISGIPIVALTAFNERARPVEARDVLKKPVDLGVLFETVSRYAN